MSNILLVSPVSLMPERFNIFRASRVHRFVDTNPVERMTPERRRDSFATNIQVFLPKCRLNPVWKASTGAYNLVSAYNQTTHEGHPSVVWPLS